MRQYIRHPADIPIDIELDDSTQWHSKRLRNVSLGGLCFESRAEYPCGQLVVIRIPLVQPIFEAHAKVVWCFAKQTGYEVGLELMDQDEAFRANMIEQICHIEHYRKTVQQVEGRELDAQAAAREWIEKFASGFPKIEVMESEKQD
jgi:hypothetical protein